MTYEEKIERILSPEESKSSANEKVVAMFLRDYRPGDGTEADRCLLTSVEIQAGLEDIAPVSLDDVSKVMVALGYEIMPNDYGEICWAMRRTDAPG